ncbi:MAG: serpin family protein [Oscillospiraceae bacterium]|nr:serpin family protein [Oscillospiraceae bacterium]
MKELKAILAMLLVILIAVGCSDPAIRSRAIAASNLMENISSREISGKPADDTFISSMADFSIELFKNSMTDGVNSLVSPISVMLALAMTANGANDETLLQMEALLGGGIALEELNEYLYSYVQMLPSLDKSKLSIANSIWFRDDGDTLTVNSDFLSKNADYFGAAAYSAAFDSETVKDINNWVYENTDGMIDKIIEEIDDFNMMFLINAVAFDAEWQSVYKANDVRKGNFTVENGAVQNVEFMHSSEYIYLDDGMATGIVKPYANGAYSFVALLPNEGISVSEYLETLTGEGFVDTLSSKENTLVYTSIPKFEYEYSASLKEALQALGIHDAFDGEIADFSDVATTTLGDGELFIGDVLHKTFISVDELGTRAGAVTVVSMDGAGSPANPKEVHLDRPFVYAIVDNATNLPIFIGTLMSVN